MTSDTNEPSYWLNWRFFLCAIWILASMGLGLFLVCKYEGFIKSRRERGENQREAAGSLYKDEAWNTCHKRIHPAWLLAYRLIAFIVLSALLIADAVGHGIGIFYFYTQWTFSLVIVYFALGSSLSIYGCCINNKFGANMDNRALVDGEHVPHIAEGSLDVSGLLKDSSAHQEPHARGTAGVWVYIFQIIFQICGGAVALTDCVFWLVLYPFMFDKDFRLHFLIVCMHSVNAVFLLGDTALNCLRFPMFRFGYFIWWTGIYVTFQWIIHAFVSLWWPYPFLDLSSNYAPLWYLAVGVMHVPCYGFFASIVKLKQLFLSRIFPGSCQLVR